MNVKQNYLLVVLMEECSEIAKVASKIYRFGANDTPPGKSSYNKTKLAQEIGDLLGMVDMLEKEGIEIDWNVIDEYRAAKPNKVISMLIREHKP